MLGVSCWISMNQEDWRSSCCFGLPVVDPCLSLSEG
ncbi:hypothetical protein A2U01_0077329, partial [Trifolium medium]|nr:hypothetical protein [Trifolium medium]